MNRTDPTDLYALLPAVYRVRDAEQGYPLRTLLELISSQAQHLKQNIDGLYDDLFIETSAEWVVPYIGDLVGTTPLHEAVRRRRADVAKTIYYRRRKGTLPMLEELARDVTGWGARAVAFFELLSWTQNLNHLRYERSRAQRRPGPASVDRVGTVPLRTLDALDRLDGPFDRIAHTVDLRPVGQHQGWHRVPHIGFFLYRLGSYRLQDVPARPSERARTAAGTAYGYTFSTLGHPMPLFVHPAREVEETERGREVHVRGPLRPLAVHYDLEELRQGLRARSAYVATENEESETWSVAIRLMQPDGTGASVPPEEILCVDLAEWKQPALPASGTVHPRVGLDVERGRFIFFQGREPAPDETVQVTYNYGFSADLGGGPYDRRASLERKTMDTWHAIVMNPPTRPGMFASVQEALNAWPVQQDGQGRTVRPPALIEIADNGIYDLFDAQTGTAPSLDLEGASRLTIQAADGTRPTLRMAPPDAPPGVWRIRSKEPSAAVLTLSGLLVEGALQVLAVEPPDEAPPEEGGSRGEEQRSLGALHLRHCTLVPGLRLTEDGEPERPDRPSLAVTSSADDLRVTLDHCITGWLQMPPESVHLVVRDSIVDAMPRPLQATHAPVLYGGSLGSPIVVASEAPRVLVTIGRMGPFLAQAPHPRPDATGEERQRWRPEEARQWLEAAIQRAHRSPAFSRARVITDRNSNHLIVLPGMPEPVRIEPAPAAQQPDQTDPTARALRLTGEGAQQRGALVGSGVEARVALGPAARLTVMTRLKAGGAVNRLVELPEERATPAQLSRMLEQALRRSAEPDGEGDEAITEARVETIDVDGTPRLLVVSGTEANLTFRAAPGDHDTVAGLGLETNRHALSGSADGRRPGPLTVLERTTLFGPVHVRILSLASEVLFDAPVTAERRQQGCVRFSYVPERSQTPSRYRTQPDLSLAQRREALGPSRSLPPATQRRLVNQLRPRVASTRYGTPDYAQLALTCASELRTGAEDGAEMGAFNLLKQPQREANLRSRLEEYLPVGLEAGLIYVT